MVELSVLSSWKEMVKSQIEESVSKLKQNFKQPTGKVLQNAEVKVTGIRPMAPVQNRGPLEDTSTQTAKFFSKEGNH